jgi:hypothetical protein
MTDLLPQLRELLESIKTSLRSQLREAVEARHGGQATLVQTVPVPETFDGQTAWEGVVYVFDLTGSPNATRAYAWLSPIEGSDRPRFITVLHIGAIGSPADAVRAASREKNR